VRLCAAVLLGALSLACGDDARGGIDTADAGFDEGVSRSGRGGLRPAGTGGTGSGGVPFAGMGGTGAPVDPGACSPCVCSQCAGVCVDCGFDSGCGCSVGSPTAPLPWEPPFAELGDDGWLESTTPLCAGMDRITSLELWSDARGVFALVSGEGYTLVPASSVSDPVDDDAGVSDPSHDGAWVLDSSAHFARTKIWFNDGSGWLTALDDQSVTGAFGLSGLLDSSLLLHQPGGPVAASATLRSCSIGTVDDETLSCLDLDPVSDLFAVDGERAYAIMGGTRLLVYDGERWRSDTAFIPYPVSALWADAETVVAVGRVGTVLTLEQGQWSLADPGTLEHFTSVWGSARDDLWAGTSSGSVYRFDGVAWSLAGQMGGVTCLREVAVAGIWGADGEVYFHTDSQIARWTGTEIESLANWSCSTNIGGTRITDLWGNGPGQVFIAVVDNLRFPSGLCGPGYVVHFDGERFHRM
jgi:hypothetical protein